MAHAFFAPMNARLVFASMCLCACETTTADPRPGSGPNGLCGCDLSAGESCCIPSGGGPATCTLDGIGCANDGGIAIGCTGYDQTSDSNCCWTGPAAHGSFTRYTSSCGNDPTSCVTDADCSDGGTCVIQKCGTVRISACDVTPLCP
jgi:hypothetical protein